MTPWVSRLIATNVAVFALGVLLPDMWLTLALRPRLVLHQPWTPITYMFVHAGPWHIFFNMLSLYFFGPRVEQRIGSDRSIAGRDTPPRSRRGAPSGPPIPPRCRCRPTVSRAW